MKLLADEYGGAVQFAYIDSKKHKNLELSFGVFNLPGQFFYKDGNWHEQFFFQILVNNIRTFIDGRHLQEQYTYRKFETPWIIPSWAMPAGDFYKR